MRRPESIRARLLLWLIVPLTLLASVVSVEAFHSVSRTSDELHDRTLRTVLLTLSEHMRANDAELVAENLLEVLTESLGDQFFYHAAGPGNAWVIGYSGVPPRPPGIEPAGGRATFYDGLYQGDPVRVVASRYLLRGRGVEGWMTLSVWQRVERRRALALELFTRSAWRLALLVGAAGLIARVAVSRGLRPLEDLREAVARRSPDDLSPIRRPVPTELRPIVRSMNALFERVSEAGRARERLIGDAAHQLRNPVAALRTQAQNLAAARSPGESRRRAGAIVDSTARLGRLVEQMLLSARSNVRSAQAPEPLDIAELAAGVARERAVVALGKGQDLSFEGADAPARVAGYPTLLREALANLIDNAIVHNPAGTAIAARVEVDVAGDRVRVGVADTGEGIGPERLRELAEPFRSGDTPTAGSGLGLSIVADVVRLHGGELTVEPSDDAADGTDGDAGKALVMTLPLVTSTV